MAGSTASVRPTDAGIVSAALIHCGRDGIASLEDATNQYAVVAAARYWGLRDTLLRAYPWNFATRFATLAGSPLAAPLFGFTWSAELPAGGEPQPYCLRVLNVEARCSHKVVGRQIYTTGDGPISIEYIGRIATELFDPMVAEILALDLAAAIFGRVAPEGAKGRLADLRRERRRLRGEAGLTDALEGSPGQIGQRPSGWLAARRPV